MKKNHQTIENDIENSPNFNQSELAEECRTCQDKRKYSRNAKRKRDSDASRSLLGNLSTWPEILDQICTGFVLWIFMLISRSLGCGKNLKINDFWRHVPEEISKENLKAVSQYVVEQFGQAEGFVFYFKSMYSLSKRAAGRPTEFADAQVYVHECSQKLRRSKPSQLPYGKTRNREGRIPLLPCSGTISVIFPSPERNVDFDIAVDFQHHLHQGRDYFGVPIKVREWIRDNARSTPQATRKELMRAIKKGEIPGVTDKYLSAPNVHYWWRKLYKETKYNDPDPWVNAHRILEDHDLVILLQLWLIIDE
jgi:hypothetical protein